MNNQRICLKVKEFQSRSECFLQQTTSDWCIMTSNCSYPIHRQFIGESFFLKRELSKSQTNILYIDKNFESAYFLKVLSFLYGLSITIERNQQVIKILQICTYLEIKMMTNLMIRQIKQNSQQYCTFVLLNIAMTFSYDWLMQICIEEFIAMDFEQLNYNRYELLQCSQAVFDKIVQLFLFYQKKNVIEGIDRQKLKKIVEEYNQYNLVQKSIDLIVVNLLQDEIKQVDEEQEESQKHKSKNSIFNMFQQQDQMNRGQLCQSFQRIKKRNSSMKNLSHSGHKNGRTTKPSYMSANLSGDDWDSNVEKFSNQISEEPFFQKLSLVASQKYYKSNQQKEQFIDLGNSSLQIYPIVGSGRLQTKDKSMRQKQSELTSFLNNSEFHSKTQFIQQSQTLWA